MSRKRPTYESIEDVFRRDLKALDKRTDHEVEEALDEFTRRMERTLRTLHERLRTAS